MTPDPSPSSAPADRSGRRLRRRRALRALALALGLALALLAGEVVARVVGFEGSPRRYFWPGIYRADPETGWALLPDYRGAHVEYDHEAPTTTNAQGWRGPAWDAARAGAAVRVLCLGDSCTFGRGVADEATWPARLEARLRARGLDAAVFNAGVPGWDSRQEEAAFARLVDVVRPTVVVVAWLPNDVTERSVDKIPRTQVLDGQLVEDVDRYQAWREREEGRAPRGSALVRLVRSRAKVLGARLSPRVSFDWEVDLPDDALAYSQAPLGRIFARARAAGATPLLVLFPRQEEVEDPASPARHHGRMAAFARAQGVEAVDLHARWRAAGPSPGRFLPRDPVHPTAAGYDDVAAAVAEAGVFAPAGDPRAGARPPEKDP